MNTDTDFEPTVRFKEDGLSISPDGTLLAYVHDGDGQFNVGIRALAGGPVQRLTSYTESTARLVAWHPDGRSLMYMADTDGREQYQLFMIDEAGRSTVDLTNAPDTWFWPADQPFSPDGRYLAYAATDRTPTDLDVLVRDLTNGEVRRVYAGGGRVYAGYWSPDSTRLSITDLRSAMSDQTISVLSIEDGTVTQLTSSDDSATYLPGPWLPDGSAVLVMTNAGRDVTGLAALDAETGELSWVDAPEWEVEGVAVSGNGRVLCWLVNVDGQSHLRARDLTTGRDLATPTLPAGHCGASCRSRPEPARSRGRGPLHAQHRRERRSRSAERPARVLGALRRRAQRRR